ncbi:MAG TPA: hypothetical protein VKB69_02920 [Micromonosporaceae bacterium]|nr:hypothetical protein [Micromonosporaceae bacterium]
MGPDSVGIEQSMVHINDFVTNTSHPTLAHGGLPAGFTVTQNLRALELPGRVYHTPPFATPPHTRELREGNGSPEFVVTVNGQPHSDPYTGPAAVHNATASPATVTASPAPTRGHPLPPGSANTVQISADTLPSTANLTFSMHGRARGCTVDPTGILTIGSTPGTVTVRVRASPESFDDVTVTITPRPATTGGGAGSGSGGGTGSGGPAGTTPNGP